MLLFTTFAFLLGACIGSFLNVVILRLPKEESLWRRGSHCTACDAPIAWYDNVPLLSYLLLRGRCRRCGQAFSAQYVLVEFLTALLFAVTFYFRFHALVVVALIGDPIPREMLAGALFPWLADIILLSILLAMTWIDTRHLIIPFELTVPGFIAGLALTLAYPELREVATRWLAIGEAGKALIVGAGLLLLVRWLGGLWFKREALGLGDVHLLIMLAMFLNWPEILLLILLSSLAGSIVGIALKVVQRRAHWRFEIPYGPYLALGAVVAHFWGAPLINWYLRLCSL